MESSEIIKKRKNTRSCDNCVQKRIKCHLDQGAPCAYCQNHSISCTFERQQKKRGYYAGLYRMKTGFVQKLKSDISLLKSLVIKKEAQMKESSVTVAEAIGSSSQLNVYNTTARTLQIDTNEDILGSNEGLKPAGSILELDLSSYESLMTNFPSKPASLKSPASIHSFRVADSIKSKSTLSGTSSSKSMASHSSTSLLQDLSLTADSSCNVHLENKSPLSWSEKLPLIPECHNWTSVTFSMLSIAQSDGSSLSFFDCYNKWVYPRIPIIEKKWLLKNMYECPIFLLHSMYICCVCFPEPLEPFITAAQTNYRYALGVVMDDLDYSNPFHVLAALHLNIFSKSIGIGDDSLAVGISMAIGLPDVNGVWREEMKNSAQVMLNLNNIYLMWIYMNVHDWLEFTLWSSPLKIGELVDDQFLISECCHGEHFLKYSNPLVTIINKAKELFLLEQECGRFDDKTRLAHIKTFDDLILNLPIYYQMRASESVYIDRGYNILNEVYIMAKLQLLKPGLLEALSCDSAEESSIIVTIKQSLDIVSKLAKAYLSQDVSSDTSLIYLQRLFYFSAIFKILIGISTGTGFREQVYELTHAMKKICHSPESEVVLYCITDKERCIEILRLS